MPVACCLLPAGVLLRRCRKPGFYTNCFCADIPFRVSQEQFVLAFYSTALFRLERFILKWVVSKPSTDEQAAALASAKADEFMAAESASRGVEHPWRDYGGPGSLLALFCGRDRTR